MTKKYTLGKQERLKSAKAIGALFAGSRTVSRYPIRILYRVVEADDRYPVKAAFTVPRRSFKRAVDRNLIRRRMRESYRLQKHILLDHIRGQGLELMMLYTGKEILPYRVIARATENVLHRLLKELNRTNDTP